MNYTNTMNDDFSREMNFDHFFSEENFQPPPSPKQELQKEKEIFPLCPICASENITCNESLHPNNQGARVQCCENCGYGLEQEKPKFLYFSELRCIHLKNQYEHYISMCHSQNTNPTSFKEFITTNNL